MFDNKQKEAKRFCLKNRVVVVTGSSGILGTVYCQALAQRGSCLVMADLAIKNPEKRATALKNKTGAKTLGVVCDICCEHDVKSLFKKAIARFGRVDAVLNNAAATSEFMSKEKPLSGSFENYPLFAWEKVIKTNLTGAFLVAREGGKVLNQCGGGSLVNVSSIYAIAAPDHRIYKGMSFNSNPAYSAGKAGVHGLTLWLSSYWGNKKIRVNTLVPGGVFNQHKKEFVRRYANRTPMGRMANRDDLIGVIIFLISDASLYCTGQQFIVDGGLTAW